MEPTWNKLPDMKSLKVIKCWLALLALVIMLPLSQAQATTPDVVLTDANTLQLTSLVQFYQLSESDPPNNPQELSSWLDNLQAIETPTAHDGKLLAAIRIRNNSENTRWFVNPYSPILEKVDVYFYHEKPLMYGDNQLTLVKSGANSVNQIPFQQGGNIVLPKGGSGTLLLRFESRYYFAPVKIRLFSEKNAQQQLGISNIFMLMAMGALIAFGVYNLSLFFASKEQVYLFLALSVGFQAISWSNIFGLVNAFLGASNIYLLTTPFIISGAFSVLFARQFLNLHNRTSVLSKAFNICLILCIVLVPMSLASPQHGLYLAVGSLSLVMLTSIVAGCWSWRRHYQPARFFVLSNICFLLPLVYWCLNTLGIQLHWQVTLAFVGLMSNALGTALLSLSLATKVSMISKENDQLTNSLEQKVYERTEALADANIALEHLISELQQASSAKSHFLANMSHEIRTPLTSIIGYADGIILGDINKSEQERVLRVISENGNHLLHIISDILDISKIEANKLEYEMMPCSVVDIISQVESVMARRATDKDLEFKLNYHFPVPSEIITDPYRFKQILLNLANNAVKFTDSGHISIDIHYSDEMMRVCVEDTGIGMSSDTLEAIFEPFEQGEPSVSRQYGGTGLGLSISRQLAIALGGDISAKSETGKGSSFDVTIKAQPTSNSTMLLTQQELLSTCSPEDQELEIPNFSGNKVLLVDDHPNNRDLIKIILSRMNIEVTEAEDGDIAVQKVFDNHFDLILMDIQMPRMKGDEATEKLREHGCDLPIIALTANNMKHEIELYMRKGFTDHLGKPIVRKEFIETLSQYLQSNGSNQDLFSNDEMLSLVAGYQADLPNQLSAIEQAWSQRDISQLAELAHRVKGAAGSFGFAELGIKFAEIEKQAKAGKSDELEQCMPEVLNYCRKCCHIEGIDIPRGVNNFFLDCEAFFSALHAFTQNANEDIEQLPGSISREENNIALLYLNRLLPELQKLAWVRLADIAIALEQELKLTEGTKQRRQELMDNFDKEFHRLALELRDC